MYKHIFLTGEIQIGKTTVLHKALEQLDVAVGGFYTGSGSERYQKQRRLYLWDAAGEPVYDEAHCVALLGAGRTAFPERFDALGCEALCHARENAELIVMDECGFLERNAAAFQAEVLKTLDGDIPVLGIARLRGADWLDQVRQRPDVLLLTVTEENRDTLAGEVVQLLQNVL